MSFFCLSALVTISSAGPHTGRVGPVAGPQSRGAPCGPQWADVGSTPSPAPSGVPSGKTLGPRASVPPCKTGLDRIAYITCWATSPGPESAPSADLRPSLPDAPCTFQSSVPGPPPSRRQSRAERLREALCRAQRQAAGSRAGCGGMHGPWGQGTGHRGDVGPREDRREAGGPELPRPGKPGAEETPGITPALRMGRGLEADLSVNLRADTYWSGDFRQLVNLSEPQCPPL